MHAIPEKGLECWRDWEEVLKDARRIYNEEGEDVSLEELRETVLHRARELDGEAKERMEKKAKRYGYFLDRRTWLFRGNESNKGEDGDYSMMEGDFS